MEFVFAQVSFSSNYQEINYGPEISRLNPAYMEFRNSSLTSTHQLVAIAWSPRTPKQAFSEWGLGIEIVAIA